MQQATPLHGNVPNPMVSGTDVVHAGLTDQALIPAGTAACGVASPAAELRPQLAAIAAPDSSAPEQPSPEQQLIEHLRRQLDQSRRMATLGELTSTTTHEFNNLLMTIINYAKVGLRHKDEATRDKALQRIYDSANRAAKVTSTVLALAKNRSGQMEPTDLRSIIEDSLMLLERDFRRYRVQLETSLDDNVPRVQACGNEFQRALINLLVNARQACREGGTVSLGLRCNPERSEVMLSVRDNGTGIPADILPRIFDPFFSTKSGPDASGKGGTGLGLASCKETIDAHQGKLRVESTVGKGTAFIIRLPALAD